ncbi:hypothetical protein STEG23_032312 [Scotinomys teguina]
MKDLLTFHFHITVHHRKAVRAGTDVEAMEGGYWLALSYEFLSLFFLCQSWATCKEMVSVAEGVSLGSIDSLGPLGVLGQIITADLVSSDCRLLSPLLNRSLLNRGELNRDLLTQATHEEQRKILAKQKDRAYFHIHSINLCLFIEPGNNLDALQLNKENVVHIYNGIEYYTVEKNIDVKKFAGKRMELENVILSEVTQTQKDKHDLPTVSAISVLALNSMTSFHQRQTFQFILQRPLNTSGTFSSMDPSTPAWSTDNTAMNGSYYSESSHCVTMYKIISILSVIVCMVGIAGNATVLWLLGFRVHRNAFTVYVLNLAGADFLYLCIQTVFCLERILHLLNVNSFYVPLYLVSISLTAYLAGLCIITAVSVERCLSVLFPIWYHCQRPRHMSSVLCALIWAFSLLLNLLLWFGCRSQLSDSEISFCNTVFLTIIVFIIVLSVIPCGFYLGLLVRIFCGSQRIPVTRLYVTIALTVVVFLLFGLPFAIFCMLFISNKIPSIFSCDSYPITTFLSCINSCANPIIYFLVGSIRHRRFQRQTLRMVLQRAMQDMPEEEDGDRGSSGNPGEQEIVWCSI